MTRNRRRVWLGAAPAVALLGLWWFAGADDDRGRRDFQPPATVAPTEAGVAVVESITDGDTFRTTDGQRVRLIGVDTPEVDDDQCFADEATAALDALIPPGTAVRLVLDVDPTDRFARTLASVERAGDGLDVGLRLASDGFALQLTVPPNVARVDAIGAAVADARAAGRGLWGPACA